jgi:endonuclease YncB( thermonuclease family)
VTQADLDPYNRPVVEIHLQQENVNLWMIQNGFAEAYRGKSKRLDRESYYRAEEQAKKEKKGIWSLKNYQSPSVFRHEQPKGDSETW